jgi:hypothetical protein
MFCSFCEALHIQLNPVTERSGNPQHPTDCMLKTKSQIGFSLYWA